MGCWGWGSLLVLAVACGETGHHHPSSPIAAAGGAAGAADGAASGSGGGSGSNGNGGSSVVAGRAGTGGAIVSVAGAGGDDAGAGGAGGAPEEPKLMIHGTVVGLDELPIAGVTLRAQGSETLSADAGSCQLPAKLPYDLVLLEPDDGSLPRVPKLDAYLGLTTHEPKLYASTLRLYQHVADIDGTVVGAEGISLAVFVDGASTGPVMVADTDENGHFAGTALWQRGATEVTGKLVGLRQRVAGRWCCQDHWLRQRTGDHASRRQRRSARRRPTANFGEADLSTRSPSPRPALEKIAPRPMRARCVFAGIDRVTRRTRYAARCSESIQVPDGLPEERPQRQSSFGNGPLEASRSTRWGCCRARLRAFAPVAAFIPRSSTGPSPQATGKASTVTLSYTAYARRGDRALDALLTSTRSRSSARAPTRARVADGAVPLTQLLASTRAYLPQPTWSTGSSRAWSACRRSTPTSTLFASPRRLRFDCHERRVADDLLRLHRRLEASRGDSSPRAVGAIAGEARLFGCAFTVGRQPSAAFD